jgi:GNAT superfamily N-acetyltransferase
LTGLAAHETDHYPFTALQRSGSHRSGKIWPSQDLSTLTLDENHRLYAARFNERLLGAVRVTLRGVEGELSDLCVREVTRRRGVGQYLVEETLRDNPPSAAGASPTGVEDRGVMAAFMQALGFSAQHFGWEKHSPGKRSATGVRQRICSVKGAPPI